MLADRGSRLLGRSRGFGRLRRLGRRRRFQTSSDGKYRLFCLGSLDIRCYRRL
jgi:hypothetical protein